MSSKSTRKTFLAQMLGVLASVGLVSKVVARPAASSAAEPAANAAPVKISSDPRAIARSQDSV